MDYCKRLLEHSNFSIYLKRIQLPKGIMHVMDIAPLFRQNKENSEFRRFSSAILPIK